MTIVVELFGVARLRAGTPKAEFDLPAHGADACPLSDVLAQLAGSFPSLAEECLQRGDDDTYCLAPAVIANIDGNHFVSGNPLLRDGQSLLLLPADAGG